MLMMLSNLPVKIIIHICTYMKKSQYKLDVSCAVSRLSSSQVLPESNPPIRKSDLTLGIQTNLIFVWDEKISAGVQKNPKTTGSSAGWD